MARDIVGDPGTHLFCTDRYGSYSFLLTDQRGICHGHLLRDFTAMASRDGPVGTLGNQLKDVSRLMQHRFAQVEQGSLERSTFVDWIKQKMRPRWEALLHRANGLDHAPGLVGWLLKPEHK